MNSSTSSAGGLDTESQTGGRLSSYIRTPPSVRESAAGEGAFGSLVKDVKEKLSADTTATNDRDRKLQEVMHQGQSFHQARLHSVLCGIADCKRKQAKLNFKMANILDEQRRIK